MKVLIFVACMVFLTTAIAAQDTAVTAEAEFNGLEKPATLKLPLPDYPDIAKKSGLAGQISVAVVLDQKGNVASTDNPEGPYPICSSVTEPRVVSLRNAAVVAAKKARFKVTQPLSEPLKGRITYSFSTDTRLQNGKVVSYGKSSDGSSPNEMRLDRITKLGSSDSDTGARVVDPKDSDTGSKNSSGSQSQSGQKQGDSNLPKTVSGGVLNQKAMQLARPTFPAAAKAVRATGSVAVQVLIHENGEVYTAVAVSGHPLFRRTSEIAACGSRFSPTLLSGQPVKVVGVITYNFVP